MHGRYSLKSPARTTPLTTSAIVTKKLGRRHFSTAPCTGHHVNRPGRRHAAGTKSSPSRLSMASFFLSKKGRKKNQPPQRIQHEHIAKMHAHSSAEPSTLCCDLQKTQIRKTWFLILFGSPVFDGFDFLPGEPQHPRWHTAADKHHPHCQSWPPPTLFFCKSTKTSHAEPTFGGPWNSSPSETSMFCNMSHD